MPTLEPNPGDIEAEVKALRRANIDHRRNLSSNQVNQLPLWRWNESQTAIFILGGFRKSITVTAAPPNTLGRDQLGGRTVEDLIEGTWVAHEMVDLIVERRNKADTDDTTISAFIRDILEASEFSFKTCPGWRTIASSNDIDLASKVFDLLSLAPTTVAIKLRANQRIIPALLKYLKNTAKFLDALQDFQMNSSWDDRGLLVRLVPKLVLGQPAERYASGINRTVEALKTINSAIGQLPTDGIDYVAIFSAAPTTPLLLSSAWACDGATCYRPEGEYRHSPQAIISAPNTYVVTLYEPSGVRDLDLNDQNILRQLEDRRLPSAPSPVARAWGILTNGAATIHNVYSRQFPISLARSILDQALSILYGNDAYRRFNPEYRFSKARTPYLNNDSLNSGRLFDPDLNALDFPTVSFDNLRLDALRVARTPVPEGTICVDCRRPIVLNAQLCCSCSTLLCSSCSLVRLTTDNLPVCSSCQATCSWCENTLNSADFQRINRDTPICSHCNQLSNRYYRNTIQEMLSADVVDHFRRLFDSGSPPPTLSELIELLYSTESAISSRSCCGSCWRTFKAKLARVLEDWNFHRERFEHDDDENEDDEDEGGEDLGDFDDEDDEGWDGWDEDEDEDWPREDLADAETVNPEPSATQIQIDYAPAPQLDTDADDNTALQPAQDA